MEEEMTAGARLNWEELEDLAQNAYQIGDLHHARELLEAAAKDPNCGPTVFSNLGLVCADLGDHLAAVRALTPVVAVDFDARVNRGLAYDRMGDTESARNDYQAALAIDPDDADTLVNLGTLELGVGNLEAARDLLARAATVDPRANWQLSDVLLEVGRMEDVVSALHEAIDAGEVRAYVDLARVELKRGHISLSHEAYERAIAHKVEGASEEYAEIRFSSGSG